MKIFLFGLFLLSAPLAQAATCKPTSDTQRWTDGSVSFLPNASQVLYQIRATGPYLTADLICSLRDCVGFVGGVRVAKGTLNLSESDSLKPVGFSFKAGAGDAIPAAAFVCE